MSTSHSLSTSGNADAPIGGPMSETNKTSKDVSNTVNAQPPTATCIVKASDMNDTLRSRAIEICNKAVSEKASASQMASFIKKSLDELAPEQRWHCFIGRVYGCYFTHDPGSFLHVQIGKEIITLFQAS